MVSCKTTAAGATNVVDEIKCASGHIQKANKSACVTAVTNCEKADDTTATKCNTCKPGYKVTAASGADGVCKACSAASGVDLTRISTCTLDAAASDAITVVTCVSGYILGGTIITSA